MGKASQDTLDEQEDKDALAAIDEGIRDADSGRLVSIEEVRKLLPNWISPKEP